MATVKVWDAQTGQELLYPQGHRAAGASVAFSPDGKRLASAGIRSPGEVKVWDAQTGQELLTLKGSELLTQRGLQPGRQTPGQRIGRRDGRRCGMPQTGQETPLPQGQRLVVHAAWPSARTANAWPAVG